MKRKLENPFLVSGYMSPEYFCDRKEETARLVSAFRNGRNIMLFAPRRMGKTGLVKNAFHRMEAKGEWKTIYVDAFSTQNQADFTRLFASAVIGSMDSSVDKALKAATRFFTHFRPTVSVDPATGTQSYSFGLDAGRVEATSSVNVSLKKLLDSGFVEKTERGYVVEDRFLGMWLARMPE